VKYCKGESVRFISHLDTARAFRRALSRAEIPVAYSQGFSPHPKISLGVPLALGHLSDAEYADVTVAKPIAPQQLMERLNAVLPKGLQVLWAGKVAPGAPNVSAAITQVEYRIMLQWEALSDPGQGEQMFRHALEGFRKAEQLVVERERKGKIQRFDVKEHVPVLKLKYGSHGIEVIMSISVKESGFPKPEEVLAAVFGLTDEQLKGALITRTDVGFGPISRQGRGAGVTDYES
jgi:radical SAM-linked protein